MFSSLILACIAHACGFLVMICNWHGVLLGLTVDFPSLAISWISMEIVGLFPCFLLVGSHISLSWV